MWKRVLPIILGGIWLFWGYVSYNVFTFTIVESEIYKKEGIIVDSQCVNSRSTPYFNLIVEVKGVEEKISVDIPYKLYPLGCANDITSSVIGKNIYLTLFQELKLGIKIGDVVYQSKREQINYYQGDIGTIVWLTFVACLFSLIFLIKADKIKWVVERRKRHKSMGSERLK